MKTSTLLLAAAALAVGIASHDAEAKRFGGGSNLGKQRAVPTQNTAPQHAAPATPATPAATPAKPGTPAPAPQGGFMSRWGGMLAGLGIGALLGSLFSGGLGGGFGSMLLILAVAAIGFMLVRAFLARGKPVVEKPVAFAGIGTNVPEPPAIEAANSAAAPIAVAPSIPADFPAEAFLRQAKIAFIRLQAANDAKDLDDIRDYTTPEMYAEISMQIEERGDAAQKTEVVNVHPTLLEVADEGGYRIASVRFAGLIRENGEANPTSFDEVWHVRQKIGDKNGAWLIAGIQQLPESLAA